MSTLRCPLPSSPQLARCQRPRLSKGHTKCWLLHTPGKGGPRGGAPNTFSKITSSSELFSDKIGGVHSLSWKQKKEQRTQRRKGRNELGWGWVGSGTERIRSTATNCQWVCNIVSNVLRLRLSNRDDTMHITLSDFCKGGGKKSEQECCIQKW